MASDRPLTTTEAAAGLGVSRSTVKNWIKEFSVGAMRDTRGDWRIAPEALPIFEEVKRLRDEGLGLDSIRRVIGAPLPVEPVARPGLVTRFAPRAPVVFQEATQACEVMNETNEPALQVLGAAIESQERLAMQLARLAHSNGQLQAQLRYAGAEVAKGLQQLDAALVRGGQLEARVVEAVNEREKAEVAYKEAAVRLEERESELLAALAKVEELTSASKGPRSGLHYHFAGATEDTQLLELQKELIKSKERIAAYEAEDYLDSKRPWWNFWD
jgi:excisionase family DNA binding protein